jgi:hypothetical protein
MNDITGVEPVGDAALVEHHQSTVSKDIEGTADDVRVGQFDPYRLPDGAKSGSIRVGDVGRQLVVRTEHGVEYVERLEFGAEQGGAIGRPSDIQADSDDDVLRSVTTALCQHARKLAAVEQEIVRPFQCR